MAGLPPTTFFLTSAVFHYLGPALAVLLFAHIDAPGVAWLRIATAALVLGIWRRPWRSLRGMVPAQRRILLGLGCGLAAMNSMFYLALERLPLSTVGAIEFVATIVLAALGVRSPRNLLALLLSVGGVFVLTDIRMADAPLGFAFAFANCAGFMLYVILGHRIATTGVDGARSTPASMSGIDQLAASMLIAAVAAAPFGFVEALPAFTRPDWLLWAFGVGVCSSVVPYVADQLAMHRLPRATFALMLALLPATATIIGLIVLGQVPTLHDLFGIGLVILGVGTHQTRDSEGTR